MPRKTLQTTLDELDRQLAELDRKGQLADEHRIDLATIISKYIGETENRPDAPELAEQRDGLIDQVREAEARFEGEHPLLAATLRRIADTLTQIGV